MPGFPCTFCGFIFTNRTGKANHERAYHSNKRPFDDIDSPLDNVSDIESIEEVPFKINNDQFYMDTDFDYRSEEEIANLDTTSAVEESKESDEDDSKIPALNDNTIYDLNMEKMLRDETYIPDIRLDMSVELLELLKKAKAPLYLYKEIFKWARKCTEKVPEFFIQKPYNKEYVVSQLEHNFNIDLKPKSIAVTLPSKKRVEIVVHDFQNCLFSLLSE